MNKWNLDNLYLSFKDENFLADFKKLEKIHQQINEYRNYHDEKALENYLIDSIELNQLIEKLSCFISLTLSVDTTNESALKYSDQLDNLIASFVEDDVATQEWIASFDLNNISSDLIKEHQYILTEIQNKQKHTLDKNSESIIAHMQNTGSSAFEKLKDQVVSSIKVTIDNKT